MRRPDDNAAIPDGWQMVRLGDVAVQPRGAVSGPFGSSIGSKHYVAEGVPVIRGNNLPIEGAGKRFVDSGFVFLTDEKADELSGSECLPDDLVFTARGTIGQVGLIPRQPRYLRYIASANQLRLRADFKKALPMYLYYWCNSSHMLRTMQSSSTSTGVPNMNLGALRGLPLLLPPLTEQRRIAAVLDAIDNAIERTNDVIAATERLRDALRHDLLSHGVPGWHTSWRDVPGVGTIPSGWDVVRLGDVAEVKSGVGFPLDRQGRRDGAYPFIKVSDMTLEGNEAYIYAANNYVDFHDVSELGANIFSPGTIVFPKVGAAIATNKKRVLTRPTIIDNNIAGVTVTDASRCNENFLRFWFESVDLFQFANVSAVPSITGSRLKRAFVSLPPLSEQQAIAAMLDAIDNTIERTRDERDALQALKASAAEALLSGRVRVSSGML